jgi:cyclopropane-fatty-acyl-phospholipid synthase
MQHILALFCKRLMRRGALILITADGKSYTCGEGPPPAIKVRFLNKTAERRVLLDPELAL